MTPNLTANVGAFRLPSMGTIMVKALLMAEVLLFVRPDNTFDPEAVETVTDGRIGIG